MVPPRVSKLLTKTGPLMNLEKKAARTVRKWSGKFHIFQLFAVIMSTIIVVSIVRLERQEIR